MRLFIWLAGALLAIAIAAIAAETPGRIGIWKTGGVLTDKGDATAPGNFEVTGFLNARNGVYDNSARIVPTNYLSCLVPLGTPISAYGDGVATPLCSIILTRGDWDLSGEMWVNDNGATPVPADPGKGSSAQLLLGAFINTTIAIPTSIAEGTSRLNIPWLIPPRYILVGVPPARAVVSGPTAYILGFAIGYAGGGPPTVSGILRARRMGW